MKKKKLYKRLLIILVLSYVIFTLANQQKTLNQYTKNISELSDQIQEQKEYKENKKHQKNYKKLKI